MSWFRRHNPLKRELANARQVLDATLRDNVKSNERVSDAAAKTSEQADQLRVMFEEVTQRHGERFRHA